MDLNFRINYKAFAIFGPIKSQFSISIFGMIHELKEKSLQSFIVADCIELKLSKPNFQLKHSDQTGETFKVVV